MDRISSCKEASDHPQPKRRTLVEAETTIVEISLSRVSGMDIAPSCTS